MIAAMTPIVRQHAEEASAKYESYKQYISHEGALHLLVDGRVSI